MSTAALHDSRDLPLPFDLLVTIFDHVEDKRWTQETFPLVCKTWRDLFYSRQASPLHKHLTLDLRTDSAPRALAWARRFSSDVEALFVKKTDARIREFTDDSFAELLSIVGPRLTHLVIERGCGSLLGSRFWELLERLALGGRLVTLVVDGVRVAIPESFSRSLGACSNLEVLGLLCEREGSGDAAYNRVTGKRWGLSRFPESVLSLESLRILTLEGHPCVTSIPAQISGLTRLESLAVRGCSLRSLPAELSELTALASLNVGANEKLGATPEAEAFPRALADIKSLRQLFLHSCGLRVVPAFARDLKSLEGLMLNGNDLGGSGAPNHGFPAYVSGLVRLALCDCNLSEVPPAVSCAMPRLKELYLCRNRIRDLPETMGRRLPSIEKVDLRANSFDSAPFLALLGAPELSVVDLRENERLQVDESLDASSVLEGLPRLRAIRMGKRWATWSYESTKNLVRFAREAGASGREVEVDVSRVVGRG